MAQGPVRADPRQDRTADRGGRARLPECVQALHRAGPLDGQAGQWRQGHSLEDRHRGGAARPAQWQDAFKGKTLDEGVSKGMPRIVTDIDACVPRPACWTCAAPSRPRAAAASASTKWRPARPTAPAAPRAVTWSGCAGRTSPPNWPASCSARPRSVCCRVWCTAAWTSTRRPRRWCNRLIRAWSPPCPMSCCSTCNASRPTPSRSTARIAGCWWTTASIRSHASSAAVIRACRPRSLSDLGIVGCETASAVHFLPAFCPVAGLWACKSGKNCPRWGRFSLSTPQVRQTPSCRIRAMRVGAASTQAACPGQVEPQSAWLRPCGRCANRRCPGNRGDKRCAARLG